MTTTTLVSYHGDPALKAALVAEIVKHREADQIEQGSFGREDGVWRGCAVACSLRSLAIVRGEPLHTVYATHADYERGLGIPVWLARLEEAIFEGMPPDDAARWPERFAAAIPVGVDLGPVRWRFGAWLMAENAARVAALPIDEALKRRVVAAIDGVRELHERTSDTGTWDTLAWSAAAAAAAAAAYVRYGEALLGMLAAAAPQETAGV